jgi:UrcA family protein
MKTALILAALAVSSSAANAAPIVVNAEPLPMARVATSDLNLGSPEGRARLEARIRGAAESICVTRGDLSLEAILVQQGCYRSAVAEGIWQMTSITSAAAASRGAGSL